MAKKIITSTTFNNGIAKLVDKIKAAYKADKNGKIVPLIEIPEEFDPRFPVVMTSLTTVVNNANMYSFYMNDLHQEAMAFEEEKGFLIGAIADESVTRAEMMRIINSNNKLITGILCTELFKELYDAMYYVAYELSKELTASCKLEYYRNRLFRELVDINDTAQLKYIFQTNIAANVNSARNELLSDYSMFTYVYKLRTVLMVGVTDLWFNIVRNFSYTEYDRRAQEQRIFCDVQEFFFCTNEITNMYLRILDEVFLVILIYFQPKVQFCYSNSFELERQLKDGTFGQDSEN